MRSDIAFEGYGGVTLRGWLYRPERAVGDAPAAGVVMAHGFSATKEMALDAYAEVLCAAGLAVLVYDHRNLGASDGEPRQLINAWAQARDYRYAIGHLAEQPDVDRDRIGIWGSSYSGGQVLVVGAIDDRVRAVVANVPFAGMPGVDHRDAQLEHDRFSAMREALGDLSGAGPADSTTPPFGPIAVVREPGQPEGTRVFLDHEESAEWFLSNGADPKTNWRNEVWLSVPGADEVTFDPGCAVSFLTVPTLYVVALGDRVAAAEVAIAAHDRTAGPKRLESIDGHHFTPYADAGFDAASTAARDFFLEHL